MKRYFQHPKRVNTKFEHHTQSFETKKDEFGRNGVVVIEDDSKAEALIGLLTATGFTDIGPGTELEQKPKPPLPEGQYKFFAPKHAKRKIGTMAGDVEFDATGIGIANAAQATLLARAGYEPLEETDKALKAAGIEPVLQARPAQPKEIEAAQKELAKADAEEKKQAEIAARPKRDYSLFTPTESEYKSKHPNGNYELLVQEIKTRVDVLDDSQYKEAVERAMKDKEEEAKEAEAQKLKDAEAAAAKAKAEEEEKKRQATAEELDGLTKPQLMQLIKDEALETDIQESAKKAEIIEAIMAAREKKQAKQ